MNQIVEELIGRVDFELPQELITSEAQSSADDMVARGAEAGMTDEQIEEQQADIIATAQVQARNNLKTNFLLQEIANVEDITVSDADLAQRVAGMAQQAKKPVKTYARELQRSGQINSIQNSILIGKAIDFLVDNANITEIEAEAETDTTEG